MNANFETVKDALKKALVKHYGIDSDEAEKIIFEEERFDDFEDDMKEMFGDRYVESVGAEVYGLSAGTHSFDLITSLDEQGKCLSVMFFGQCNDVEGAQKAMDEYDSSKFGEVLPIEYAVENTDDEFALSYVFDTGSADELIDEIDKLFEMLNSEELIHELDKVLRFF